jgi:tRNA(Ile)-lysidine synthase TilS/MesJ
MISKARQNGQTELTACAYCGVLRRKAINTGARQVKATKIATGHTLDDEVQTALMNIFRGDIARLAKENQSPAKFIRCLCRKLSRSAKSPKTKAPFTLTSKKSLSKIHHAHTLPKP